MEQIIELENGRQFIVETDEPLKPKELEGVDFDALGDMFFQQTPKPEEPEIQFGPFGDELLADAPSKATHPIFDKDLKSMETTLSNVGDTFRNFMINAEGSRTEAYDDGVGNLTIGVGHKLTDDEKKTGLINIGGESIEWRKGLNNEQINILFTRDMEPFNEAAQGMIMKGGLTQVSNLEVALSSLLYNVGVSGFKGTKAHKALLRGDLETFKLEAFDKDIGFISAGGNPILRGRRQAELELLNPNRGIERTQMIAPGGPIGEADLESFRKPVDTSTLPREPESIESLETDGAAHTIVSGDTLDKIARDNNTTVADIMAANPQIKDANKIGIGDQINLKETAPATAGTDRASVIEQATPPRKLTLPTEIDPLPVLGIAATPPPLEQTTATKLPASVLEKTAFNFWKALTKVKPGLRGVNFLPSSWKIFANHVQGFVGITDESILRKEELQGLINIVIPGIKAGKTGISYRSGATNTGFGANSTNVGYGTKINLSPEIKETLQFTLGKADIVKHNGKIIIADEYDMAMNKSVLKAYGTTEKKLRNGSLIEKWKYILDTKKIHLKFHKTPIGNQGMAHRYAELFAAKAGESLSQRYTLGTFKELGLTDKDVAHLPTLEQYEKDKLAKGQLNPKNIMA